jgi:hypothetical protein
MSKVKFALIALGLISFAFIFALIRSNFVLGANMEKENPKAIFERVVANLSEDIEMLKQIKCHDEITLHYEKGHFETCFAYKWFAPAFQTYVEKVLQSDLSDLKSAQNDYGTPSIVYNLSKNSDFYLHFIYRSVEISNFLKEFDDLKGYKGQIRVIVAEK